MLVRLASAWVVSMLCAACAASAPSATQARRIDAIQASGSKAESFQATGQLTVSDTTFVTDHKSQIPARQAGWRVPSTTVRLPRTAKAGSQVQGQAPAGSVVEFEGTSITVDSTGTFTVPIPPDAQAVTVTIKRPTTTPMTLRIDVAH